MVPLPHIETRTVPWISVGWTLKQGSQEEEVVETCSIQTKGLRLRRTFKVPKKSKVVVEVEVARVVHAKRMNFLPRAEDLTSDVLSLGCYSSRKD